MRDFSDFYIFFISLFDLNFFCKFFYLLHKFLILTQFSICKLKNLNFSQYLSQLISYLDKGELLFKFKELPDGTFEDENNIAMLVEKRLVTKKEANTFPFLNNII